MGKEKYQKEIESLFKKSPIVSLSSIGRIIKNRKKVRQYAKQLIRNLILKGKVKRITKGFYTIHNNSSLAVFCFRPAYLGLQDALSFHNLWEQETIPVIITTRKIRRGVRKILGANVLIRRIEKKYFFGIEYTKEDFYFPYSDIEKTLLDLIYFKEKVAQETLENIKSRINRKKFDDYLKRYPEKFKKKVLNMLDK